MTSFTYVIGKVRINVYLLELTIHFVRELLVDFKNRNIHLNGELINLMLQCCFIRIVPLFNYTNFQKILKLKSLLLYFRWRPDLLTVMLLRHF